MTANGQIQMHWVKNLLQALYILPPGIRSFLYPKFWHILPIPISWVLSPLLPPASSAPHQRSCRNQSLLYNLIYLVCCHLNRLQPCRFICIQGWFFQLLLTLRLPFFPFSHCQLINIPPCLLFLIPTTPPAHHFPNIIFTWRKKNKTANSASNTVYLSRSTLNENSVFGEQL